MKNKGLADNTIYSKSHNNRYRYSLGTKGKNTLYCIGINPSTATPENYDNTIKKVRNVSREKGFDSFVMLNIYPLRATDPDNLPEMPDWSIHKTNVKTILGLIKNGSTVWAAWGNSISKRPWLTECRDDMFNALQKMKKNICFVRMGDLTVKKQPRHPLYCPITEFLPFTSPNSSHYNYAGVQK